MADSWIADIIPLPRPEYAKQPEALLTDLLWRSEGSNLHNTHDERPTYLAQLAALPGGKQTRLIPLRSRGASRGDTVETFPLAKATDITALIAGPVGAQSLVSALLSSILAPRARGDKSFACVPLHPDVIVLQTLQGLVNKNNPPDLAKVIEVVGWLGGSSSPGHVASLFLAAIGQRSSPGEGVAGLLDTLFPVIAQQTWECLTTDSRAGSTPPLQWPGVGAVTPAVGQTTALARLQRTPFRWFWNKWSVLCDPANKWCEKLPIRRFIDWSTYLLRTGLAFAYLWEAEFFIRIQARVTERTESVGATTALGALRAMLADGALLASVESPLLPGTQKDVGQAMRATLAKGYAARKPIADDLAGHPFGAAPGREIDEVVEDWIDGMVAPGNAERLQFLREHRPADDGPSKNTREFVRYLLLPRSADDDSADQADFYSFARSNSRHFWFEPGPEWLVVVTSLLGQAPRGKCTLGMLLDDLARLGVRVERWVLIGMLEEAGLRAYPNNPAARKAINPQAKWRKAR